MNTRAEEGKPSFDALFWLTIDIRQYLLVGFYQYGYLGIHRI